LHIGDEGRQPGGDELQEDSFLVDEGLI